MNISPKLIVVKDIAATTGGNLTIETGIFNISSGVAADSYNVYRLTGTQTLSSDLDIVASGTLLKNLYIEIYNEATITLSGNDFTIFGVVVPAQYAVLNFKAECMYNGSAWVINLFPNGNSTGYIGSTALASDSVITSKILDKNVTLTKLEDVTSARIIVGNSSNIPTAVAMSGDVTISNAGVTAIGALKVLDAMINDLDAAKLTGTLAAARIASKSLASTKLADVNLMNSQYSDTATTAVTTAETLYSYTVPAATFTNDGEGINVVAYGSFAATANAKSIVAKFGTNTYASNAITTSPNGLDFKIEFQVLRAGAASAVGYGEMVVETVNQGVIASKGGITWANANNITIVGQNGVAAANDIVLSLVIVSQIR